MHSECHRDWAAYTSNQRTEHAEPRLASVKAYIGVCREGIELIWTIGCCSDEFERNRATSKTYFLAIKSLGDRMFNTVSIT